MFGKFWKIEKFLSFFIFSRKDFPCINKKEEIFLKSLKYTHNMVGCIYLLNCESDS